MFVRKKKNKSGGVSVQIIDKSTGVYKVLKTIGSSSNQIAIESLMRQAQLWIQSKSGVRHLDFDQIDQRVEMLFDSIESVKLAGIDLLLGKIFDEIGFSQIGDEILFSATSPPHDPAREPVGSCGNNRKINCSHVVSKLISFIGLKFRKNNKNKYLRVPLLSSIPLRFLSFG